MKSGTEGVGANNNLKVVVINILDELQSDDEVDQTVSKTFNEFLE